MTNHVSDPHAWLAVRQFLRDNRFELTADAAEEFSAVPKIAGTPLLTRHDWIPPKPILLQDIVVDLDPNAHSTFNHLLDASRSALPDRAGGSRYTSYADAMAALARPAVFENRPTYRLLNANLSGPQPRMQFGLGHYFDSINTGEAAAHAYAAFRMGEGAVRPVLREVIGDPTNLAARPANLALSTLTIRHDRDAGSAQFVLHWRDPARVGHAGGLYQVVPVGVFQPSGQADWNIGNDFSLWKNLVRELAEELGGHTEDYNSEAAPIDYHSWDFAVQLNDAIADGRVNAYCLGLGVDPLSNATDLLTAVVIDARLYDDLFGAAAAENQEGRVLDLEPFTSERLDQVVAEFRMQAAGAAALRLAEQIPLTAVLL